MKGIVKELVHQLRRTVQEPGRLVRIPRDLASGRRSMRVMLQDAAVRGTVDEAWNEDAPGTQRRLYESYADYERHQRSKMQHLDLSDYDVWFRAALAERLAGIDLVRQGLSCLCLAARIGTEVKAFHDRGCFAVGIDLNPGPDNAVVLPGDFHRLQFPDACIDLVYTNSLDHAFDARLMLGEVGRVLKSDGLFMLEAPSGSAEGITPEFYESFWWNTLDDLAGLVEAQGFWSVTRLAIEKPFVGECMIFRRSRA